MPPGHVEPGGLFHEYARASARYARSGVGRVVSGAGGAGWGALRSGHETGLYLHGGIEERGGRGRASTGVQAAASTRAAIPATSGAARKRRRGSGRIISAFLHLRGCQLARHRERALGVPMESPRTPGMIPGARARSDAAPARRRCGRGWGGERGVWRRRCGLARATVGARLAVPSARRDAGPGLRSEVAWLAAGGQHQRGQAGDQRNHAEEAARVRLNHLCIPPPSWVSTGTTRTSAPAVR